MGLQLLTIVLSRGNIFMLGEAYAFGVMWSFAMKGLAVLVLRYKQPGKREFRVPLNLKVGSIEIPVGLGLITLTLVALCVINLFTKQVATISGVAFTDHFLRRFRSLRKDHQERGAAAMPNLTSSISSRATTSRPRAARSAPRQCPGDGPQLQHAL